MSAIDEARDADGAIALPVEVSYRRAELTIRASIIDDDNIHVATLDGMTIGIACQPDDLDPQAEHIAKVLNAWPDAMAEIDRLRGEVERLTGEAKPAPWPRLRARIAELEAELTAWRNVAVAKTTPAELGTYIGSLIVDAADAKAERDEARKVAESLARDVRFAIDGWNCGDLSDVKAFDNLRARLAALEVPRG